MRRTTLCILALVATWISGLCDGRDRIAWAQSGPVSSWHADGNTSDSVDSNPGTLVGAGYMTGVQGQAFSLDEGGYVDVGNKENLNFGNGDFTIDFWANTVQAPTGNDQKIFVNKQTSLTSVGRTGFEVFLASPYFVPQVQGTVIFVIRDGTTGAGIASTRVINDGSWHHVVAIKKATSLLLCVDGMLQGVKPHTVAGSISTATSFRMGELSDRTTGSHEFVGGLDEISVFNRARSLDELHCGLPLDIDVKPGSSPNSINSKDLGTIPVAILSSSSFSAPIAIDVSSLRFGHTGSEESLAFCNTNGEDVDGDGLLDLVCHFDTQKTAFQKGDTLGYFSGMTNDGLPVLGTDSVRIVH